jgi:hypothetical protein
VCIEDRIDTVYQAKRSQKPTKPERFLPIPSLYLINQDDTDEVKTLIPMTRYRISDNLKSNLLTFPTTDFNPFVFLQIFVVGEKVGDALQLQRRNVFE